MSRINANITRREAKVLNHDSAVLKKTVAAAKADGTVTAAEAKKIQAAATRLGHDSFTLSHNAERMPKLK